MICLTKVFFIENEQNNNQKPIYLIVLNIFLLEDGISVKDQKFLSPQANSFPPPQDELTNKYFFSFNDNLANSKQSQLSTPKKTNVFYNNLPTPGYKKNNMGNPERNEINYSSARFSAGFER